MDKWPRSAGDGICPDSLIFSCFIIQPSHNLTNRSILPNWQESLNSDTFHFSIEISPVLQVGISRRQKLASHCSSCQKVLRKLTGIPVEGLWEVLLFCPKSPLSKAFLLRRKTQKEKFIKISIKFILLWIVAQVPWCYRDSSLKKKKRKGSISWKRKGILILGVITLFYLCSHSANPHFLKRAHTSTVKPHHTLKLAERSHTEGNVPSLHAQQSSKSPSSTGYCLLFCDVLRVIQHSSALTTQVYYGMDDGKIQEDSKYPSVAGFTNPLARGTAVWSLTELQNTQWQPLFSCPLVPKPTGANPFCSENCEEHLTRAHSLRTVPRL